MNTQVIVFEGNDILCADVNGVVYVAIRPIAEVIGLHVDSTINNLQEHAVLGKKILNVKLEDKRGRQFPQVALPIDYLNGWLFGIDISKVKESVRPKLERYQEQCYEVLRDYFFGKHKAIEMIEAERFRLLEARRNYEGTITHAKNEIKKIDLTMEKLNMNIFGQLDLMQLKEADKLDLATLREAYMDHSF